MGLFGSLFTAVSGLNAQSEAMGIISNNIANSSTTGYKSNSASFADLVTQADLTNAYDPGGVKTSTVQNVTTQGTVEQTDSNTDLAVSGDGMFVVTSNPNEATLSSPYYTRSGDFSTDSNGNLVNTAGFYLMGWKLDSTGALPADSGSLSSLTPINVDVSSSILQQTSKVSLNMNVDSTQTSMYQNADGSPGATTGTPNYTTQLSVVDSLGTTQTLDVNMTQNYPNAWTMQITGAGANYPTNSTYGVLYNSSGDIQAIGQVTAGASTTATVASSGTAGTTDTSSISGNVMTVTQTVDTGTTATATTTSYTYGSGVVSSGNPATVTLPDMDFGDGSSTTQQVTLDASNFTQFASDSNVAVNDIGRHRLRHEDRHHHRLQRLRLGRVQQRAGQEDLPGAVGDLQQRELAAGIDWRRLPADDRFGHVLPAPGRYGRRRYHGAFRPGGVERRHRDGVLEHDHRSAGVLRQLEGDQHRGPDAVGPAANPDGLSQTEKASGFMFPKA